MRIPSLFLSTITIITIGILSAFWTATPVQALRIETQKERVTLSETSITESVVAIGKDVEISANVDGDIFCAGETVRISGNVSGDVICAAKDIVISGIVEGNIRAAGQSIDISGPVDRAVTVAGETIRIGQSTLIGTELIAAGKNIELNGSVDGKLTAWAQSMAINGELTEDASIHAQHLSIGDEALIHGQLAYQGQDQAVVSSQAIIEQPIHFVQVTPAPKTVAPERRMRSIAGTFIPSLMMMILGGVILTYLFPGFVAQSKETLMRHPLQSLGVGFLILITGPVLGVLMLLTIIGIPFAMVWFLVWILILLVSFIPAARWIGEKFSQQFHMKAGIYAVVIIGSIVLSLIGLIPLLGKLVHFIVYLAGAGSFVLSSTAYSKKKR